MGAKITIPKDFTKVSKRGRAEVSVTLKWNKNSFGGNGGGGGSGASLESRFNRGQEFLDNEVLNRCEPFVPKRTGMLIKSGILGTKVGDGKVKWITPYAKRQYYSARKPGSTTGPLRGPFWFPRMWAVWKDSIIAGLKKIIGAEQ